MKTQEPDECLVRRASAWVIAALGTAFGIAGNVTASPCLAQATFDPMRVVPGPPGQAGDPVGPALDRLPDGPGAEETATLCSACHSLDIVKQQRLTDERWDYLFEWMITTQGMPEQDEETKQRILTYLKTHFSAER